MLRFVVVAINIEKGFQKMPIIVIVAYLVEAAPVEEFWPDFRSFRRVVAEVGVARCLLTVSSNQQREEAGEEVEAACPLSQSFQEVAGVEAVVHPYLPLHLEVVEVEEAEVSSLVIIQ